MIKNLKRTSICVTMLVDFDDEVIKKLLKLFIEKRIKDLISGVNDRMTCFQNILNANIIKSIAELKDTRDVNMPHS